MPNLGPQYDLAARLAALEDTVRRMQQNPLAQALSMTQSDGSVGMELGQDPQTGSGRWIVYQGTTTGRDPNTDQHPLLMYLGEIVSGGAFVDSGLIMFRPDGSESLVIGNKGVGILDATGHTVLKTDEDGKTGLSSPWIPLPTPQSWAAANWPQTASTSDAIISVSAAYVQHPAVRWYAIAYAPAGTNGQVHLQTADGATVGQTWTLTGGQFLTIDETITLAARDDAWQADTHFEVHGNVTSGTGAVQVMCFGLYGKK